MRAIALAFATTCLLAAPGALAEPPPAPAPVPVPAAPSKAEPAPETFVSISVRVVEATPRAARSLRRLGAVPKAGDVPTYDPAALARQIECWTRARHVTALSAPRVMTSPGQTATVTMGEDVKYVRDYEIRGIDDYFIADPVLDTVFKGLRFECVPELGTGGVSMTAGLSLVDVRFSQAKKVLPIGGEPVIVQLPEVHVRNVQGRLLLAPGRAALLADLPPSITARNGRVVMAWIEAHATVDPVLTKLTQEVTEKVR